MSRSPSGRRPIRLTQAAALALVAGALAACDRGQAPAANPATPPAKPQVVAEWRAFTVSPPAYNLEALQLLSDGTCAVVQTRAQRTTPCRWARTAADTLRVAVGEQTLTGRLTPPRSHAGQAQPGTAAYLALALPTQRTQYFVLASSPDDAMVRAAVAGEYAWQHNQVPEAITQLRRAVGAGDDFSRLRLAWRLATTKDFQQPEEAVTLLEPLAGTRDYNIQSARAAAFAAAGRFADAVKAAEGACTLAPKEEAATCAERLAAYQKKQPLVLELAAAPGAAAPNPPAGKD